MVIQCWADVVDGGPTLDERLVTAGMPRITKQFALFYYYVSMPRWFDLFNM